MMCDNSTGRLNLGGKKDASISNYTAASSLLSAISSVTRLWLSCTVMHASHLHNLLILDQILLSHFTMHNLHQRNLLPQQTIHARFYSHNSSLLISESQHLIQTGPCLITAKSKKRSNLHPKGKLY
jgi:hypothetical protein